MIAAGTDALANALKGTAQGHVVIVTGAGISLASGIPTFRGDDPDAVWNNDVTELGTYRFFRRDPVAKWQWSMRLFDKIPQARPNEGHRGVVALERWIRQAGGRSTLITQNIDSLHEQAGSDDVIKVHGSADRVRCADPSGCVHGSPSGSMALADIDFEPFIAESSLENLPTCPACGDYLRQHVLWFDEFYDGHDDYQWSRVQAATYDIDLLLFIGTSFSVGVTDMLLSSALIDGKPVFAIDPVATAPHADVHMISARAEDALPELCRRLGASVSPSTAANVTANVSP